ncbi:MAG: RagB/SusD family nutrient uptake outer membrane protein, partial [Muribaculaceae bacterium]|nr:RagB/SusD family nutrient uptake outer membrane protein [Muribaculaceae bacterium]
RAIQELKGQRRSIFNGYNEVAKLYYETGTWNVDPNTTYYDTTAEAPNVTRETFTIPFPTEDLVFNPNLKEPAIHEDVRALYAY